MGRRDARVGMTCDQTVNQQVLQTAATNFAQVTTRKARMWQLRRITYSRCMRVRTTTLC